MPLYRGRLEAQDGSGHWREIGTVCDSEDEARVIFAQQEANYVAFDLLKQEGGEAYLESLQAAVDAADGDVKTLSGKERAHFAVHHQTEPYEIVEVQVDP